MDWHDPECAWMVLQGFLSSFTTLNTRQTVKTDLWSAKGAYERGDTAKAVSHMNDAIDLVDQVETFNADQAERIGRIIARELAYLAEHDTPYLARVAEDMAQRFPEVKP